MLPDALAASLGLQHKHLPYTNTRLVLQSEVTDDDYFFGGCVVRCWVAPDSHPAVRQTLQGLEFRWAGAGGAVAGGTGPAGARTPPRPTGLTARSVSWGACRRVSLGALAVQAIVNKRGARGAVGARPRPGSGSAGVAAPRRPCSARFRLPRPA